jgi:hypothetical protein
MSTENLNMWKGYKHVVFDFEHLPSALKAIQNHLAARKPDELYVTTRDCDYLNIPCGFDIETTSFKSPLDQPLGTMYIWQAGIDGVIVYGRTWEQFQIFISRVTSLLKLNPRNRLIFYVHNLAFEFQWIRFLFTWDKVFAIKNRRPVYAVAGGIEFRCSYFLSNMSLATVGKNLVKYPVKKLEGDLDYKKLRHSGTPLTEEELAYCINDVRVIMSYIQEKIEHDGSIAEIPLTNTGYVRNFCREACFNGVSGQIPEALIKKKSLEYHALMKSLQVNNADEYKQMKRAFAGGFTHASSLYSNRSITTPKSSFVGDVRVDEIGSADRISAYPFEMCTSYFPMTRFNYLGNITKNSFFNFLLKNFCCMFDVEFQKVEPLLVYENPWSISKCVTSDDAQTNNGRLVSASLVQTTMTELDFETFSHFYTWKGIRVTNMRVSNRGYLPLDLILAILSFYEGKTTLKGIEGKETEYMVLKNMLNAGFGMMVTNIVRKENVYEGDDWIINEANVEEQLSKYNAGFNRFLYYAWGIWVTAHARRNLFRMIEEFDSDYVYADTDSVKGVNFSAHLPFIKRENQRVINAIIKVSSYYKIPLSKFMPKTNKGIPKVLGLWEQEQGYASFKTIGAKRYMYEYPDGTFSLTISGLNKKFAVPWLLSEYDNDIAYIFHRFGEGFYVPKGHTGRQDLKYIDYPTSGYITDYLGNKAEFHELSSIYMEESAYRMSSLGDYFNYLKGVQYVEQ